MMALLRNFGATKVSKALLLLLVLCFGAWGIGGYLSNFVSASAMTVNGEEISPAVLEQLYKYRVDSLAKMMGTQPTKEQLAELGLPEQAVQEIVARTVLRQTAAKLGIVAATRHLQDEIAALPPFHNPQGQFDPARYRQMLQQVGRTPEQFERDMGNDIAVRELTKLAQLEAPAPSLIAAQSALENASYELEVATLKASVVPTVSKPTEAMLATFYADNEQVYARKETRDLVILPLSRAEVAKTISVPEKQVREEYDANKDAYNVPEKRVVRHILAPTREEAAKWRAGIKNVDDFAKAANAHSTDPGNQGKGGELGLIAAKDVVPAFSKVAFSLPVGQVSEPVQSNFGWHLIWVDKIEPGHTRSFDDVKDAITKQLQDSEADDAFAKLATQVDERVAAGKPLDTIAKELGLKPQIFPMVDAKTEVVAPALLEAGFALAQGDVSAPVTQPNGDVAYVQATKVMPGKLPPLADMRDRVVKDWTNAQIQTALQQLADKMMNTAKTPGAGDLAASAAKAGLTGVDVTKVSMKSLDDAPQWLQPHLIRLLPLPVGAVLPTSIHDGETWHVVRLTARTPVAPPAAELDQQAKVYQKRVQADLENLLIGNLMCQAKVVMHDERMVQLFGRPVAWNVCGK